MYVSGTGPVGADTEEAGKQTLQALSLIEQALANAGAAREDVVRTRMYLTLVSDWPSVGAAHKEFFGETCPAATMVVVAGLLHPSWRVEIEADAVVFSSK